MSELPINFEDKVKETPDKDGYPYRISANDLMQNFVYAAGEYKKEDFDVTESKGEDSPHTTRKISLKNPLVGVDQGNIPAWNKNLNDGAGGWQMLYANKQGNFFYWNTALNDNLGGWQTIPEPTEQGQLLFWNTKANDDIGGWELVTASTEGSFLYWDDSAFDGAGGWTPFEPPQDSPSIIYYDDSNWNAVPVPIEGTHVLGAVDGTLQWIATEEC